MKNIDLVDMKYASLIVSVFIKIVYQTFISL